MKDSYKEYPRRLSVQITDAMDDKLEQVARGRDEAKSEVVRTALRAFLDEQEDVIGSRKHFTKMFGRRIDQLERLMVITFWVNLQSLHLLHERVRREPVDMADLLSDVVFEGVKAQEIVSEFVESAVARQKTKPPA